jgi:hypothetical protein
MVSVLNSWSKARLLCAATCAAMVLTGCTAHTANNSATTSKPAAPEPVLGRLFPPYQKGYGEVKPTLVFNGGDPTGRLSNIRWSSWGGPTATGSGTALYVAPNQIVAQGEPATATVVAFDLGMCAGKLAYQKIGWYFPTFGEKYNPQITWNICTDG